MSEKLSDKDRSHVEIDKRSINRFKTVVNNYLKTKPGTNMGGFPVQKLARIFSDIVIRKGLKHRDEIESLQDCLSDCTSKAVSEWMRKEPLTYSSTVVYSQILHRMTTLVMLEAFALLANKLQSLEGADRTIGKVRGRIALI